VQRTQPIIMITFMSMRAGSCPVCVTAADLKQLIQNAIQKIPQKRDAAITILVSQATRLHSGKKVQISTAQAIIVLHAQIFHRCAPAQ
jgi:hypothetical protein